MNILKLFKEFNKENVLNLLTSETSKKHMAQTVNLQNSIKEQ